MKKVLVVEDEELVRRGIVCTVDWERVDCTVVGEAANGAEALALIRREQPDLVISDIKMPVMDGMDMLRTLREEGNPVQLIFLTAYSDFAYAQSAVKLGAVDYLLKPFHDGELEQAIVRLRDRAPQMPDTAAQPADGSDGPTVDGVDNPYVLDAMRYMDEHYADPDISIGTVAASLGISEGYLSHVFKKETGSTLGLYLSQLRIRAAMELLKDYRSKVNLVAARVGYRDVAYFSSSFKRAVGLTPTEYQRQLARRD